jgi:hypothetical protein
MRCNLGWRSGDLAAQAAFIASAFEPPPEAAYPIAPPAQLNVCNGAVCFPVRY